MKAPEAPPPLGYDWIIETADSAHAILDREDEDDEDELGAVMDRMWQLAEE